MYTASNQILAVGMTWERGCRDALKFGVCQISYCYHVHNATLYLLSCSHTTHLSWCVHTIEAFSN